MLIFWIIVFIVALAVLVKSADWLILSAEKIGFFIGLPSFIIGVTIVAVGTSLPELVSSLAAVFKGVPEVVAANVIGSNIANILLIVGICGIIARRLVVKKSLIDLDLPLLAIGTILFLGVLWDRKVTFGESLLMLITYSAYLLYSILDKKIDDHEETVIDYSSKQWQKKKNLNLKKEKFIRPEISIKDFVMLIAGIAGLFYGAKYLIDALVNLSSILNVPTGIITITTIAVGTSLPELLVSVKASFQKKSEIALGNIFGSNIFNALVVTGFSGLFRILPVDNQTFIIGLPTMALATLIFIISGISRRIHIWEGLFYLAIYILFIAKLFNWF